MIRPRWAKALFVLPCLAALACGGAALDSPEIASQRQLEELRQRTLRLIHENDREAAMILIEEMATLDPEHPKLYATARELYEGSDYEGADELFASFGSSGPGLDYGRGLLAISGEMDAESAERHFTRAAVAYARIGHKGGLLAAHGGLGWLYAATDRVDEAVEYQHRARDLAVELRDRGAEAAAVRRLAQLEAKRGDPEEALKLNRTALSLCDADDPKCLTRGYIDIGRTLRQLGRDRDALAEYRRALPVAEKAHDIQEQIVILRHIAGVHERANAWQRAIEPLERAIALATEVGEPVRLARLYSRLGQARLEIGDNGRAVDALRRAADAFDEAGERYRDWSLRTARELGRALTRTGEFSAAAEVLRAAVEGNRSSGDREQEAMCLILLGLALSATGDQSAALVATQRGQELFVALADTEGQILALNNLGMIDYRLGDPSGAREEFALALALARGLQDPAHEARALNNLAIVAGSEGDAEAALDHGRASLKLREELGHRRDLAITRINLADALADLGRLGEAAEQAERALAGFRAAGDPAGEAIALVRQADVERRRGNLRQALRTAERALRQSERRRWRVSDARATLALVHDGLGRPERALEELERAMESLEAQRAETGSGELAARFLAGHYGVYEHAIDLTLRLRSEPRRTADTFRIAERARARSLTDLLTESVASLRKSLPRDLMRREAELTDAINAAAERLRVASAGEKEEARRRLQQADARFRRFAIELRDASPGYGALAYPEPQSLDATRKLLDRGETLVVFHVGERNTLAWVVTATTATLHELDPAADVRVAVDAFLRDGARDRPVLGGRQVGTRSAEQLAETVLPVLPEGTRRLLVVPDGPLHRVPFAALRRGSRYLVEDLEIVVVPSATALAVLRHDPRPTATRGFVGIGDPLGEDPGFPPLAASGRALDEISALFDERSGLVLAGARATKSRLRAAQLENFRYIHFATHGWIDDEDPRRCGLKLTPEPGEDPVGFLYLDEVFGLQLAAELVVLSSCRSGLGESVSGEGLIGLTRAFLHAGARSVIATLWNVNDRHAADFMSRFYRELKHDGSAAAALRRTQVAFIRSEQPRQRQLFAWAPFVLVGGPRR